MSKETTTAQVFKTVLIQGSILIAAIAIVGGSLGYLFAGMDGLISALIGAGLSLLFVSLTAISVAVGGRLPLGGFFGMVLGGWLVKLVGFAVLIGALKNADFINGPVMFFTLVASIMGTLVLDSLVVLRSRITVGSE